MQIKRLLVDYRVTKPEYCVEYFTISNLDTQNIVNRYNCDTCSFILAPYGTSYHEKEKLKNKNETLSIKEMTDETYDNSKLETLNKAIKYAPIVIEANKEYETKNNGNNLKNLVLNDLKQSIDLESSFFRDQSKSKVNKAYNALLSNKGYNSMNNYNESIIKQMIEIGYTKDFITTCLRNNELNYCTACYYMLMKKIENLEDLEY